MFPISIVVIEMQTHPFFGTWGKLVLINFLFQLQQKSAAPLKETSTNEVIEAIPESYWFPEDFDDQSATTRIERVFCRLICNFSTGPSGQSVCLLQLKGKKKKKVFGVSLLTCIKIRAFLNIIVELWLFLSVVDLVDQITSSNFGCFAVYCWEILLTAVEQQNPKSNNARGRGLGFIQSSWWFSYEWSRHWQGD